MPRIRTIKPEFWSSPGVAGANPWVRLLFIAMWNWADDHGRGTANVKELAAFAFPHDDDPEAPTSAELPCMLAEVAERFAVVFYEADGRRYYAIPSWDDHQRNERRALSRHPAPEVGTPYNPDPRDQRIPNAWRKMTAVSDQTHGSSAPTDGSSGPGTGEQGNRGSSSSRTASSDRRELERIFHEEFWPEYPLKKDKQDALKMWLRVVPERKLDPARLVRAARSHAADPNRKPGFTKHAATWLNKGAYDNEPEIPEQAQLSVVPALPTSVESFRERATGPGARKAAEEAAGLIRDAFIPTARPRDSQLSEPEWIRRLAAQYIDDHADEIRAALQRRAAG